jgi:Rrf2 family nitric oxide-sensitive transcriptional repressor
MRLSAFTDYSLRLLMYLAAEPGRRATIAEVAQAFGISEHHLGKVAHGLGRGGWLANARGKGGGLALAVPAAQIGIGAVVRYTERGDLPAGCFGDPAGSCPIDSGCALRGALADAVEAFYAVLDRSTLADLTRQPQLRSQLVQLATRAGIARTARPAPASRGNVQAAR